MNEADQAAQATAISTLTEMCSSHYDPDIRLQAAQNILLQGSMTPQVSLAEYGESELTELREEIDRELRARQPAKTTQEG